MIEGGKYFYVKALALEEMAGRITERRDHSAIRRRVAEYLMHLAIITNEIEWEDSDESFGDWVKVRKELREIEKLGKLDTGKLEKARRFDMIQEIVEAEDSGS